MLYDPHSGVQLRALRSDPTGRHSPIVLDDDAEPWWVGYLLGVAFACVLAVLFWWAL